MENKQISASNHFACEYQKLYEGSWKQALPRYPRQPRLHNGSPSLAPHQKKKEQEGGISEFMVNNGCCLAPQSKPPPQKYWTGCKFEGQICATTRCKPNSKRLEKKILFFLRPGEGVGPGLTHPGSSVPAPPCQPAPDVYAPSGPPAKRTRRNSQNAKCTWNVS